MAKSYNGLNAYKIELAEIGICPQCGRRLSLCEHATEQQRTEWRIQDAELLEEIEQQRILDNITPEAQAEYMREAITTYHAEELDWLDEMSTRESVRPF